MSEKANYAAGNSQALADLPPDAVFTDGWPAIPTEGGVLVDSAGQYYSLAHPDAVHGGVASLRSAGADKVLAKRIAQVPIHEHTKSQPTTLGAEWEYATTDERGNYVPNMIDKRPPELYTIMGERSTPVIDNPDRVEPMHYATAIQLIANAEAKGQYVAPLAVIGQREPKPEEQNPTPYIADVTERMEAATGFNTRQLFRVAGYQPHTGISNTEAALKAQEAIQYLNPILTAPSLAGPFLNGGVAGKLQEQDFPFTEKQQEHMQRVGIGQPDLIGGYHSHRYKLRRLASPSAGIWLSEAPDDIQEYLNRAHQSLAQGDISSIDRLQGWHTDRVRAVLDQSGASTLESGAYDTFLGNPAAIASSHLLHSAVTTRLEALAMQGYDPREIVAKHVGIDWLTRKERLHHAHRMSLHAARLGNDAKVYGKRIDAWLPHLIELADKAPYIRLSDTHKSRLQAMYAPSAAVYDALRQWYSTNPKSKPPINAYFEQPVGNPATYMIEQYDRLRKLHPGVSQGAVIRHCELSAAKAFHNVARLALAA